MRMLAEFVIIMRLIFSSSSGWASFIILPAGEVLSMIGLIHHETGLATLLDILLGDARVKKHLLVLVIKLRKKSLPRSRKMETVITKFNAK